MRFATAIFEGEAALALPGLFPGPLLLDEKPRHGWCNFRLGFGQRAGIQKIRRIEIVEQRRQAEAIGNLVPADGIERSRAGSGMLAMSVELQPAHIGEIRLPPDFSR